jgi:protein SFI1
VLADYAIAPEHDQRFFRYLLRLGEGSAHHTRSLLSKLRRLLAKLDIQIVVQDEDDAVDDELDSPVRDHVRPVGQELGMGSAKRGRRASFNDTMLDETWVSGGRLEAMRATHSPHASLDELSRTPNPSAKQHGASPRGRYMAQTRSEIRRSRSLSTQDSPRPARPPPKESGPRQDLPFDHQDALTEDDYDSDNFSSSPINAPIHQLPPQTLEQFEADLTYEADAFLYTTRIRTARQCLRRMHQETTRMRDMTFLAQSYDQRLLKAQVFGIWATKTLETRQAAETEHFFEQYERRATRARDLFLLNKAFTHWAQSTSDEVARTSVARRHILRTRYFNAWRDITAVNDLKCRQLGLRKWLSVWRTNTARKQVDHERALAIYDENIVRRTWWKWFWAFCERKAPVWHHHRVTQSCMHRLTGAVSRLRQHQASALQMRNNALLRRTFGVLVARKNAVQSMDQTARDQYQSSLVGNHFHHLLRESKLGHAFKTLSANVSARLLTKTFSIWHVHTQNMQQAVALDRRHILQHAWTQWNNKLRTSALRAKIDDRIVLENLYRWVLQARLALFRRVMDSRLQERALQTISLRLSDKRFRLEEAEMIFNVHKRRRMLASVMLRFHGISRAEEMMERQAVEFRNVRDMDAVLPHWIQRMQHLQKLNRWSSDARFYCLASHAIKKWKDATAQAQRNKRRDAYVQVRGRVKSRIARDCFVVWKERANHIRRLDENATQHVSKRRINAGISIFSLWRDRTQYTVQLSVQADEFSARILFLRTMSILVLKGQDILLHHRQALALRSQTIDLLATETLKKLKWALFCHKRSLDSAQALQQRNAIQHRRNMLRYWAEQASRLRASRTLPLPLQDDVIESPTKPATPFVVPTPLAASGLQTSNLFSSLRLSSARKTPAAKAPLSARSRLAPLHDIDDQDSDVEEMDFGVTHRTEEWTGFDFVRNGSENPSQPQFPQRQRFDSAVAAGVSTPIPGYMTRTPSKRSARTIALSSMSNKSTRQAREVLVSTTATKSTTPGPRTLDAQTPQVTPFERKMRQGGYGRAGNDADDVEMGEEESFTPATFRRTRFGGVSGFGRSVVVGAGGGQQTGRSVRFFDVGKDEDGVGEEIKGGEDDAD